MRGTELEGSLATEVPAATVRSSAAATPRAQAALTWRSSIAPTSAPPNMQSTDVSCLRESGLVPPAKAEFEARLVSVEVMTVVVMPSTRRRRTVALRTPMAKESRAITV